MSHETPPSSHAPGDPAAAAPGVVFNWYLLPVLSGVQTVLRQAAGRQP